MRIRKIKTKDKKITLVFETMNKKAAAWDEFSMTCSDAPREGFEIAMKALAQDVVELCEFPMNFLERVTVKGVSYSYGGELETMGAVITAQVELLKSDSPMNVNTPHKPSDVYSPDQIPVPGKILDTDTTERLLALHEEAVAYIDGDRLQTELPLETPGEGNEEAEELPEL